MSVAPSELARKTPWSLRLSNSKRNKTIPALTFVTKPWNHDDRPKILLAKHSSIVLRFAMNIAPNSGESPVAEISEKVLFFFDDDISRVFLVPCDFSEREKKKSEVKLRRSVSITEKE